MILLKRICPDRVDIKDIFLILFLGCVIGIFSPVAIFLPFSPVPMALQPHIILFLSALFGSRRAFFSVLSFIMLGSLGFPVFAGCSSGFLCLLGPRGGYLIGYMIAAFVTGMVAERSKRSFLAMAAGNLIIFMLGAMWLSLYLGINKAFMLGVVPFVPGDLLKLTFFSYLLKRVGSYEIS